MRHPWSIASRQGSEGTGLSITRTVFVKCVDSAGNIGIGEASPVPYYDESPETVVEWLSQFDVVNLDFSTPESSDASIHAEGRTNRAAQCALSTALWDGAANHSQVPLFEKLSLKKPPESAESSFTIGLADPSKITEKVRDAEDCPLLKLKVGLPTDFENLAALRLAAYDKRVRIDANEAWSDREQALKQIESFARDPKITCVEQPMPRTTPLEDMIWLKERSPLPLMADESYRDASDIEAAALGFHWANVKLVKAGGPAAAVHALESAKAAGLDTMIGCMIESSQLISTAAHLISLADTLDLDGAALSANDPMTGAKFDAGSIHTNSLFSRTGVGAQVVTDDFLESGWHSCG